MSEEKIQGTVMAGAANAEHLTSAGAAPSPAARRSIIEALAAQQGEVETLDTGSALLGLKKPQGSNYLRAIEMAEGNASLTPFIEAMLCIVEVNGTPHPTPRNKSQVYALADMVGRTSIDSLLGWYQQKTMPELSEILTEHPEIAVGSPEFMEILNAKRGAKAKK